MASGVTTYANGLGAPIATSSARTPHLLLSDFHTDIVGEVSTTGALVSSRTYTEASGVR